MRFEFTTASSASSDEGIRALLAAVTSAADAHSIALLADAGAGRLHLVNAIPSSAGCLVELLGNTFIEFRVSSTPTWLHPSADGSIMLAAIHSGAHDFVLALAFGQLAPAQKEAVDKICQLVLPLLTASLRICQSIDDQDRTRSASATALHAINVGVVMLSRGGAILFSNRAADRMMETGQGLQNAGGSLRPEYLADGILLQAALTHVLGGPQNDCAASTLLTFRRKDKAALIANLIVPGGSDGHDRDDSAILYIVDPDCASAQGIQALCRLHGLSPVETALVCHLVRGEVLAEAARKMRIKELTARSYLKQIFLKTNTRRQSELIIQMLNSLAPLTGIVDQEAMSGRFSHDTVAPLWQSKSTAR